jgi:UDP-N-acetylglucosamine--N-acetylmuramyl-(pentapeptide) pyrophosphoryl-undecaprenol N-acetylglucosamine transferase
MVVAGGGTGGHFFPAQAILKALQDVGVKVKYIGSRFGVEAERFTQTSEDELFLNIRGIQRHLSMDSIIKNILFPFRFLSSYYKSRKLLNDFKPHVVIGTGGYSSGLPLLAAIHKGIKTVIQEQNSFPGITTRHLSTRVDKICIAYDDATLHLKKKISFSPEIQFGRIFK